MLGSLLPIWVLVLISISDFGLNSCRIYEAMHQPFTYLVLSGTYLTSTFYIISKSKKKNKIFPFTFTIFLILIGYLITDKKSLEDLSASFYKELSVVLIFSISISMYIYYQFKYYYNQYNTNQTEERQIQFIQLEENFDNLEGDEEE